MTLDSYMTIMTEGNEMLRLTSTSAMSQKNLKNSKEEEETVILLVYLHRFLSSIPYKFHI
jgi:hypothetical protein